MKVSFLGLGLIGSPMAGSLIRAGHSLTVYNRTPEKSVPLGRLGAKIAPTSHEAIDSSPVSIFMVADVVAIRSLLFPEGSSRPDLTGRTIIQMSTISSGQSLALGKEVEECGGDYLEAPVLGGPPDAEKGELVVLAGASEEQFRKWLGLFKALSPSPVLCGPVGSAAVFKLALNHFIAAESAALALSLALVIRTGIDPGQFMGVLRKSALYAPQFDKKLDRMLSRDFDKPTFPEKHLLKDVSLAIAEGKRFELDTVALEGIEHLLREAVESGLAELDYSALYNVVNPPGR